LSNSSRRGIRTKGEWELDGRHLIVESSTLEKRGFGRHLSEEPVERKHQPLSKRAPKEPREVSLKEEGKISEGDTIEYKFGGKRGTAVVKEYLDDALIWVDAPGEPDPLALTRENITNPRPPPRPAPKKVGRTNPTKPRQELPTDEALEYHQGYSDPPTSEALRQIAKEEGVRFEDLQVTEDIAGTYGVAKVDPAGKKGYDNVAGPLDPVPSKEARRTSGQKPKSKEREASSSIDALSDEQAKDKGKKSYQLRVIKGSRKSRGDINSVRVLVTSSTGSGRKGRIQGIGIPKPLFAFHASIVGFPV